MAFALVGGAFSFVSFDWSMLPVDDGLFRFFVAFALLIGVLFAPLMVAASIAFQAINPFSDEVWDYPSHYSNPFDMGNPLPSCHFGAFFSMAVGAGMILGSPFGGLGQLIVGFCAILMGLGSYGAFLLSIRWFHDRVRHPESSLDKQQ